MIFSTIGRLVHMTKAPQSDTDPFQMNCGASSVFFGVKLQDPIILNKATSSLKHINGDFGGFFRLQAVSL